MKTRLAAMALALLVSPLALAGNNGKFAGCETIPGGTLMTSEGEQIFPGYDQWGYNYQARQFKGDYCGAYRNAAWCQPYIGTDLIMQWNDAWLDNKDCDGDGLLDRHRGHGAYIGSGAWITNHMQGTNTDGTLWTYFVKIVAAPADATRNGGIWYAADGTLIGPVIWGEFAIVQEVINDPATGDRGASFVSPVGPGFGKF